MLRFRAAIPDACFEILDLTAEDDRVAARLRITGTPQSDFGDIAPDGEPSTSADSRSSASVTDGSPRSGSSSTVGARGPERRPDRAPAAQPADGRACAPTIPLSVGSVSTGPGTHR